MLSRPVDKDGLLKAISIPSTFANFKYNGDNQEEAFVVQMNFTDTLIDEKDYEYPQSKAMKEKILRLHLILHQTTKNIESIFGWKENNDGLNSLEEDCVKMWENELTRLCSMTEEEYAKEYSQLVS